MTNKRYKVYMIDFYGTNKIYIGCTVNISQRFAAHKSNQHWIELFLMPKSIRVLKEFNDCKKAAECEEDWIMLTQDENLNQMMGGYNYTEPEEWTKEDEKRQKFYDSIEKYCHKKRGPN